MKTAERGIFSFITGTGYYKKDVMKEDVERIKDVLLQQRLSQGHCPGTKDRAHRTTRRA
ncbi:MAG: hypothetical protein MZV70_59510 [Desulfobacterales bacterium]|nr:hypothetical protein [Desulfobacterales bacterium]